MDGLDEMAEERAEEDEEDEETSGGGLDILDVLDAMASHYGEPIREMLQQWSWKLFCARWRRLVDYTAAEQQRREEQEREAAFQRMRDATARELAARTQGLR